jgi:ATP-binding cassette subfamily B protein
MRGGAAFRGVDVAAQKRLNAEAPQVENLGARVVAMFRPYAVASS